MGKGYTRVGLEGDVIYEYENSEEYEYEDNFIGNMLVTIGLYAAFHVIKYLSRVVYPRDELLNGMSVYGMIDTTYYLGTILVVIMLILLVGSKVYDLYNDAKEDSEWLVVKNGLLGTNRDGGYVSISDVNKIVLVGDETKEDILEVRRLYILLKVNKEGEVYLTDRCRTLKEVEQYRQSYCKDTELREEDLKNLNSTFKTIMKELEYEELIKQSEVEIEKVSIELDKEREKQQKYLNEYHKKYGLDSKPTNLLNEKDRLDNKVVLLGNKLGDLTVDLEELRSQVRG